MTFDPITPHTPQPAIVALPSHEDAAADAPIVADVLANALQRAIALGLTSTMRDHMVADYVSGAACAATSLRPSLAVWLRLIVGTVAGPKGASGVSEYLNAMRRLGVRP